MIITPVDSLDPGVSEFPSSVFYIGGLPSGVTPNPTTLNPSLINTSSLQGCVHDFSYTRSSMSLQVVNPVNSTSNKYAY